MAVRLRGVLLRLLRSPGCCALSGVLLLGCVTSSEGEAMQVSIARNKARLDEMDARYAAANKAMDGLRQVVDQANELLTRNSADLGSRVESHEQDLQALKGKLEEILHVVDGLQKTLDTENTKFSERIDQIDQNQQKLIEKVAPTMPTDKEQLWREANARLSQGQRDEARRYFRNFVTRFPTDPRAARAQLAVGKTYTLDGNHRQAAGTFQKVLDDYARSGEVPEAMYELGRSFIELRFCGDARAIFLDLARRYPKSSFAKEARTQAAAVRKIQNDKTRCTS